MLNPPTTEPDNGDLLDVASSFLILQLIQLGS